MTAALVGGRPETIILSRGDVAALMNQGDWVEAVETGFRAAAEGKAEAPPPMAIHGAGGTFHAKGAALRLDRPYAALKLNGNFPDNPALRGLPTIQGAILLCDGETGALLAIMDSIEVTLRRTAAATALAARFLARRDSSTMLVCGCGEQGTAQLAALRPVFPLRRVFVWDKDEARAAAFAEVHRDDPVQIVTVTELRPAALASDIIVTCTTAREPFLDTASVRPGTFIGAVGADSPDKSEIEPDLMARALVVADVLDQCVVMGDLHHALAAGVLQRDQVHAELGDLVTGRRPGRSADGQITLFDSTGTALQDVACAVLVYRRAGLRGATRAVALGARQ